MAERSDEAHTGSSMKFLLSLVLLCAPLLAMADLRFGVISPIDGGEGTPNLYMLGNYFSTELGTPVTVVRYPPNRIGRELLAGTLSFALINPVVAVEVVEQGGATSVATLKINGIPYFAGAIIARRDRGITKLSDLKGKDVLAYQKTSAGAYVFQLYHLYRNGIDPFKDLKSIRHNNKQADIVFAVQAGRVDAGFVRSGVLESLAQEGKIPLNELIVIDEKHDALKQKHSTELYPEFSLLVSNRLEPALQERIRQVALSLKPDMPAAKAAGIDGFIKPLSLDSIKEALRTLHLPPFDY